jgi:hypothetical protein
MNDDNNNPAELACVPGAALRSCVLHNKPDTAVAAAEVSAAERCVGLEVDGNGEVRNEVVLVLVVLVVLVVVVVVVALLSGNEGWQGAGCPSTSLAASSKSCTVTAAEAAVHSQADIHV